METSIKKKIHKGFKEIPIEMQRFLRRDYPSFVTARKAQPLSGEVPVFMFHYVDSYTFQEQLEFLRNNGYHTLTLKEFMAFLNGEFHTEGPSVLLTFDDGDTSWYHVAYPLLKQFGFHAIGFVVPHYIKDQTDKKLKRGWLSWSELIEMDQSKVFDVQSHTYYHDRIFFQPVLVDFSNPLFNCNPLRMDVPWIYGAEGYTNKLEWGTPIYRYASRFEGRRRYIDDENIRQACVSWVKSQGGKPFFSRQSWRKELKGFYKKIARGNKKCRYESTKEQRQNILDDLTKSKEILEEKLNKPIHHLCYPWGEGSALALSLSMEAGYISNFWGTLRGQRSNTKGESPFYVARLKDDYIFRLPGSGRKSLLEIFRMKLKRRVKRVDIY